jgi:hypothetical protein
VRSHRHELRDVAHVRAERARGTATSISIRTSGGARQSAAMHIRGRPDISVSCSNSLIKYQELRPAVSRQAVLVASAPNCSFQVLVPR